MSKYLLLFLLFLVSLNASSLVTIDSTPVNIEDFQISYYIDDTQNMPLQEVLLQDFTQGDDRLSLGMQADVTWVKIVLSNKTTSQKELYIHNAYTYLSTNTHFYELEDDKAVREAEYGPANDIHTELIDGAEGLFKISLAVDESKTIMIRSESSDYQIMDLGIFDKKSSSQQLVKNYVFIVVFVSILLTLGVYNLILFIASRHKEYIYYALYLISASIPIAYNYGMVAHYFSLYGESALYLNAVILLNPIFMSLFIKEVFLTRQYYKSEDRALDSNIIIFSLAYLYSFYDYSFTIQVNSFIFAYFLAVLMWVSISIYRKKDPLINYFLIAHIFFLIFSVIALLFYNDLVTFNYLTSHSYVFGTMIEAFLLGFLLSHRIRLLRIENSAKDKMIITDGMTKLYNKSHFNEYFRQQFRVQHRARSSLCLMLIDIDYFKQYNDTYGHLEGDKALISVAATLKERLNRPTDMAFRVGGEEFAVLCSDLEEAEALAFADSLRKSVQDLAIEHESSIANTHLSISIGVCDVMVEKENDLNEIYRHADEALYLAKERGRDQVALYSKEM